MSPTPSRRAVTATAPSCPSPNGLRRLRDLLALWLWRQRSRRELSELPPHLLRDIGLDEGSAAREAAKPFWR